MTTSRGSIQSGFTLIELMVAIGLFAIVMTLASGSYLMMVSLNHQAEGLATGIDNLSFALETMTRTIRTGTQYNNGVDCSLGCGTFSVHDASGNLVSYSSSGGVIYQGSVPLTDSSSVTITNLTFYVSGTEPASMGDRNQPYVSIIIEGTTSAGPGKTQQFDIETSAVMRGIDL